MSEPIKTTEPTPEAQVARIFEWRRGFNAIYLIDLGVKLGLFRALAESAHAMTAAALAQKLTLSERHVGVWCMVAYGLGLLEAQDSGSEPSFRLASHFDSILAKPGHPRYLGGYVRLGTEVAAEDFRRLIDAFRSGENTPFQGRGEDFARVIADSTAGLQVLCARKILPALPGLRDRLDRGGAILEIGCGTGQHLLQLAKAFPNARLTGIEIDEASLALARKALHSTEYNSRIKIESDLHENTVASTSFDAAVMVEVLHEIAPALRAPIVEHCHRALKAGGWLAIIDETFPSSLKDARSAQFQFPLQTAFEELLWGNVIPTRQEQERLLRDAGFAGEIKREMVGEGFTVLTTQK